MEGDPQDDNVHYLDEYPDLQKKVWLRRLNEDRRLGRAALTHLTEIIPFPRNPDDPDPAA